MAGEPWRGLRTHIAADIAPLETPGTTRTQILAIKDWARQR